MIDLLLKRFLNKKLHETVRERRKKFYVSKDPIKNECGDILELCVNFI